MKITDKDRLDFLEELSSDREYSNVELIQNYSYGIKYYQLWTNKYNSIGEEGNTFRQAIDNAIRAMKEKDNGNNG